LSLDHHSTGSEAWIAEAWSSDKTHFGALFVAEADTRSTRNHLWHLRDGVDAPSESLARLLAYGRNGDFKSQ
jgi:hypothetical protein